VPAASSSQASVPASKSSSASSIEPSTSVVFTSAQTTLSATGTATATPSPSSSDNTNKTGIIAGATVGGLGKSSVLEVSQPNDRQVRLTCSLNSWVGIDWWYSYMDQPKGWMYS
jgi:hypothetical protein